MNNFYNEIDCVLDLQRDSLEGRRFASAESAPAAAIVGPGLGDASMRHLGLDGPGLCRGSPGGRPVASGEAAAEVGGPSEGGLHGVGGVSAAGIHKRFTVNKAIHMNRKWKVVHTVNNARLIWDQKAKPKGLFGGHLNIRSLRSKSDQIIHMMTESNLDYYYLKLSYIKIPLLLRF